MKKTIFFLVFILFGGFIFAQNEVDALRFSDFYYSSTARATAMANAFGALGADLSTASTNPAGIGIYKHSSATFTPSVMMSNMNSDFNGTQTPADRLSVMINNLGIVISAPKSTGDIKAFNISFGYNRTNNFSRNLNISGVNNKGSLLDSYMLDANGNLPSELDEYTTYKAYDTWLIDNNNPSDTTAYESALWYKLPSGQKPKYGETQTKAQQVSGGAGEYFANFAINYKNFLYFGATLGFQSFSYNSIYTYSEKNFVDNPDLKSFTFTQNIIDQGSGINLKLGLILKPTKFLRIGAAFHSPTYFTVNDSYFTNMQSFWNSPDPNGNYDYNTNSFDKTNKNQYNLLTPMRLMGDVGIILGDHVLIGLDYEHLDYSSMRMSSQNYMYTAENKNIRTMYKPVDNYRAGIEFHTGPIYLRAGYALIGSPYKSEVKMDYSRSQISGGVGLAMGSFFVDASYVKDLSKYNSYLYNGYTDEPVPAITQNDGIINITFGTRF